MGGLALRKGQRLGEGPAGFALSFLSCVSEGTGGAGWADVGGFFGRGECTAFCGFSLEYASPQCGTRGHLALFLDGRPLVGGWARLVPSTLQREKVPSLQNNIALWAAEGEFRKRWLALLAVARGRHFLCPSLRPNTLPILLRSVPRFPGGRTARPVFSCSKEIAKGRVGILRGLCSAAFLGAVEAGEEARARCYEARSVSFSLLDGAHPLARSSARFHCVIFSFAVDRSICGSKRASIFHFREISSMLS